MPFAGVDAHKRYSRVVVKDETGSLLSRASLQNDVASFRGFFSAIDGPTKAMLDGLRDETGLPCNPHTFRRTFACLLRKAGVDTMTIKDLGRWESLEMVQRYTRSVTFEDSLKFYKAPLG